MIQEQRKTEFPIVQVLVPLMSFQMLKSHDGISFSIYNLGLLIFSLVLKFNWAPKAYTVLC